MLAKVLAPYIASLLMVGVMPVDPVLLDGAADGAVPPSVQRLHPSPRRASLPLLGMTSGSQPVKADLASYGPQITAESAIVVDAYSGATLYAKNPDDARPIGSISKLMAGLVFLDTKPNLDATVSFLPSDITFGGRIYISANATLATRDLLKAAIISSDNSAVMSLVRLSGMSKEDFVARMNAKAQELGLRDTTFDDPTGLSSGNTASARDITGLLAAARLNPVLAPLMSTVQATIMTSAGPVVLDNTDDLLRTGPQGIIVEGGKTGYIPEAGYCVTSSFYKDGARIFVVVLGTETPNARFRDASALAGWAFETFTWPGSR